MKPVVKEGSELCPGAGGFGVDGIKLQIVVVKMLCFNERIKTEGGTDLNGWWWCLSCEWFVSKGGRALLD